MWKDFLFFSKGERNGLLVLACLILLMFAVNFCIPSQATMPSEVEQIKEQTDSLLAEENDTSLSFLREPHRRWADAGDKRPQQYHAKQRHESTHTKQGRPQKEGGKTFAPQSPKNREYEKLRIELNTADTTTLKQLRGIGSKLSLRIVKYRKKIGGFTHKEQLKNIYGLSEETYQNILPHVWVDTTARNTEAPSESE